MLLTKDNRQLTPGCNVRIASGWSSLDGQVGKYVGIERGYIRVQHARHANPILWEAGEIELVT